MIKKYVLTLIIQLFCVRLFAISLGLGVLTPSLDVSVNHPDTNQYISLVPNTAGSTQYQVHLEAISLSLTQANDPSEDQQALGFESETSDFQFGLFLGESNLYLSIQDYSGYYVSNASEIDGSYTQYSSESKFEDLKMSAYSLRYIHVFNGNEFNFDSLYGIAEIQKKSAGSFLLSLGASKRTSNEKDTIQNTYHTFAFPIYPNSGF